ncbi:MAG: leucyl aminopeptidase [Bacteroidetes bacterium]|nr:leucyl aminopeptidase [Bacteroidota bacterium]MBP7400811.1 leucyl aminopeptidase [Chitinophagales bacterium]MBK7110298.1 leucyl aminopeptidase [Bacteroidota bacterium]MBK8488415.1 leucyl aminopeptidase [Bacteroidota bacterium]MBK8681821.1 leucyl aminopeptidase [Bacteroidota bacterium]
MNFKFIQSSETNADHTVVLVRTQDDISNPLLQPFAQVISKKLENKETDALVFYTGSTTIYVVMIKQDDKMKNFEIKEACRQAGGKLFRLNAKEKSESLLITQNNNSYNTEEIFAIMEGFCLAQYQFNKYKKDAKTLSLTTVQLNANNISQSDLDAFTNVIDAVTLAKNIINEPVISFNSVDLGNLVIEKSKQFGFNAEVLQKQQIESLKMGGLLGVNFGSTIPPTFSVLTYKPVNAINEKPFILVGKGVTYDTGGYSLKPSNYMGTMKSDMSGAAAVLGTITAIASNKLPVYVIGLMPSTDNRIGNNALVPDDIIIMGDGTSVEVQNTDAEGRLILADALHYAKQFDPELVIDLATLTGAASAITGSYGAALMGTDFTYRSKLIESGLQTFERVSEIPFWTEFSELLKSDVADLKNIGGPVGGASTAGKFLEHFTDYPWLHLDIAGTAFLKEENGYRQRGGVGFGIRLLYHFLSGVIARMK